MRTGRAAFSRRDPTPSPQCPPSPGHGAPPLPNTPSDGPTGARQHARIGAGTGHDRVAAPTARRGSRRDGARLGHQGEPEGTLEQPHARVGGRPLVELVLLGEALLVETHPGQGADAGRPRRQYPYVFRASHHERPDGSRELDNPDHKEDGLLIQEQGELQDGHLLPLRRFAALSYPHDFLKS